MIAEGALRWLPQLLAFLAATAMAIAEEGEPTMRAMALQFEEEALSPGSPSSAGLIEEPMQQNFDLRSRLVAARNAEVRLNTANDRLRQELMRWRRMGSTISQHEAQVAKLMQHASPALRRTEAAPRLSSPPVFLDEADRDGLSLLSEAMRTYLEGVSRLKDTVRTYIFDSGRKPLSEGSNALRLVLIFCCANAVAFSMWHSAEHIKKTATRRLPEPVLRRFGLGRYFVEISEVTLENLPAGEDVYVSLQMGVKRELRTVALEPPSAGPLRFGEVFNVELQDSDLDSRCICRVIDRNGVAEEQIAHFEISAEEVLRLARCRPGEDLSFALAPSATRWAWKQRRPPGMAAASVGGHGDRPCLSMRLRHISSAKPHKLACPDSEL